MSRGEKLRAEVAARLLRLVVRLVPPTFALGWLSVELENQHKGTGDAVVRAYTDAVYEEPS